MSSHVPSPTSSPNSGAHDSLSGSQENIFRSSQISNPDSSCLSLESSFQLDTGYPSQYEDSQKHPKGKRKRTTTQDKAILEAAYNANPKPDKAARLDLVKRVTLNEKEVQIWFQNRRQNDRRKSRPLSPQEIAQLRFSGGLNSLSSDLSPFGVPTGVDAVVNLTRPDESERRSSTPGKNSSQEWPRSLSREDGLSAELPKQERRHSEPMSSTSPMPGSQTSEKASGTPPLSQSFSQSVGYLCNRWHMTDSYSAPATVERLRDGPPSLETFTGVADSSAHSPPTQTLPPPASSSNSQFRLSLSLEGKAEIVSSLQSPPRPVQQPSLSHEVTTLAPVRAPRSLQRSKSSLPGITLPPISSLTANLPPQLTRGRSRDVSAWESCCDADTRDELTKLAENESSGSAIAAISLLRSSSQTSLTNMVHGHAPTNHHHMNVLRPNSSKRNAAPSSRRDSTNKKPKLGRSASSVARLQSLPPSAGLDKPEKAVVEFEPEKKGSLSVIMSPSGDSDKENWSPDDGIMSRRRPLPSIAAAAVQAAAEKTSANVRRSGARGVLGDSAANGNSAQRMFLSGRSSTAPVPRLRGGKGIESSLSIFEDGENEDEDSEGSLAKKSKRSDEEVERFMRGEVSPSKKGDVDCVAGLLALSQGNWR